MALTPEQTSEIYTLTTRLRQLGCAVCVFEPSDVESAAEGQEIDMTPDQAGDWLLSNRKYMEDLLAERGNLYISDNLEVPVS